MSSRNYSARNILFKKEPIPVLVRSMAASGSAEEGTHCGIHVPYVFRVRTNSGLFMHTRNRPQKRGPSEFQARPNAGIKLYFSVGNIKYKILVCGCVCTFSWGKVNGPISFIEVRCTRFKSSRKKMLIWHVRKDLRWVTCVLWSAERPCNGW